MVGPMCHSHYLLNTCLQVEWLNDQMYKLQYYTNLHDNGQESVMLLPKDFPQTTEKLQSTLDEVRWTFSFQLWPIHFKYLFVYLQRLSSLASWHKWQQTCATRASSLCDRRENIQIHISSGRRSHFEIASLLCSWNGTRNNGLLKSQYREERSHTLKIN